MNRFPEITNIEKKQKEVAHLVTKALENKFQSEFNTNTSHYAQQKLDGYCYVPNEYTLWEGRYCRYLCFYDITKVRLRLGGFVLSDNGYTVTIKQKNRLLKINKRNKYWFMTMTEDDQLKIKLKNIVYEK